MCRNATWTLSNLCRGKNPPADFALVSQSLPLLSRLLWHPDDEALTDACWALSYLSDGPNENIEQVISAGVCVRLVELLHHQEVTVVTPALRTVGNIVTGNDRQTQIMLNSLVLPALDFLLRNERETIRKETCWTLSNITAGTKPQIQKVIDANIMPSLIAILQHGQFKIRKEAAWALSNATMGGDDAQIRYLVEQGCVPPLCDLLEVQEPRIVEVVLDGLENILMVGQHDQEASGGANMYAGYLEDCGGLEKLEYLQQHPSRDIYEKVYRIIDDHFSQIDGEAAEIGENGRFAFGAEPVAGPPGGYNL